MYQSDGQRTDCGRSEDVPSESESSCDILYLDVTYHCFQGDFFLMNSLDVETTTTTKITVCVQTTSKTFLRIKGENTMGVERR